MGTLVTHCSLCGCPLRPLNWPMTFVNFRPTCAYCSAAIMASLERRPSPTPETLASNGGRKDCRW